MRKPVSSRRTLIVAAGSLAAIVSIAAVAQAATDTIYRYTTPKTGSFSISPLQLTPNSNTVAYSVDFVDGGRIQGTGCFTTGVHLPQGATMTGLTTFWSSTLGGGGTVGPSYTLIRSTLNNGVATVVASGTAPNNTGGRKHFNANINAGTGLVNNNQNFYTFEICMGASDTFYGARISYTYTTAGD